MYHLIEPVSRLKEPLSIDSIINEINDFSIRTGEDEVEKEDEMEITKVYPYDKLEPFCLLENLEVASDSEEDTTCGDISNSFSVFRKKMTKITEDGKVMKLLEKEGIGTNIPQDGRVVVYLHYAAYIDLAEYPFDVTRLRHKKPLRIRLGIGEVIYGLDIAIRSMKIREKSKFLIHPDLAYGERGIPPRIPPNATVLFDVEIFDICEDTSNLDDNGEEIPKTFEEKLKLVKQLRNRGNKIKILEKNMNGAISMYKKCLSLLVQAHYANAEQEKTAKAEMVKIYTNLAVCYSEQENYKKVCIMYNDAKNDCQELAENNVKLLYNSAKALRCLGNYVEATKRLRKAMRLKPGDESVRAEIIKLDECKKNHKKNEKMACKKMFGFCNATDDDDLEKEYEETILNVGPEFRESFFENIDEFLKSDKGSTRIDFGSAETAAEREFMKKECHRRKLRLDHKNDGSVIIKKQEI